VFRKKTKFDFIDLDGTLFHMDAISDKKLPLKPKGNLNKVKDALTQLQNMLECSASPFFALLLMDGDNMGKMLSGRTAEEQESISVALTQFTQKVPKIVDDHAGWLIYAGGDDVFALLPVDKALDCAFTCRKIYQDAFSENAAFVSPENATISAAIEYAHMKVPLGPLVQDAHRLLDHVAKEYTGRDALACRVWKRGGPILTWAQPWKKILIGSKDTLVDLCKKDAPVNGIWKSDENMVAKVRRAFQHNSEDPHQFSSKFFHKLKDLFEFANSGNLFDEDQLCDLLTVEYLANREHIWDPDLSSDEIRAKASARVKKLLKLCRENIRHVKVNINQVVEVTIEAKSYRADGALLVRFLSQKEV
jgi:CRISPR-associated protein Cmr2